MEPIIRVAGLGKKYVIRHQARKPYETLRDTLAEGAKRLLNKSAAPRREEFWALRNVSFDVKPGDKLGIIGRNGAGKTTLLKILSRITEPSAGRVEIRGRVASLLEVGTGFHPELTGRENIFLNGAILGMHRREILQKFDEIVAFAEVDNFLDTPVKRYSSGMAVRLAFAVAAYLESEILLIDEVLAVGDAQFQQKCLGKMEDVSTKEGRTVLFVSHNMGAASQLCSEGILLEKGVILTEGAIKDVIGQYMFPQNVEVSGGISWPDDSMPGDNTLRLKKIAVLQGNNYGAVFQDNIDLEFEIELHVNHTIKDFALGLIISNSTGTEILHTQSNLKGVLMTANRGINIFRYFIPSFLLKQDRYTVSISASIPNKHLFLFERDIFNFGIETSNIEVNRHPNQAWKGVVNPQIGEWEIKCCPHNSK